MCEKISIKIALPIEFFSEFRPMQVSFFPPFVQPAPEAFRSFTKNCMTIARACFEIPARVKTDPILSNYLARTVKDNARSGLRRAQAEMPLILFFTRRRTNRKDTYECCAA